MMLMYLKEMVLCLHEYESKAKFALLHPAYMFGLPRSTVIDGDKIQLQVFVVQVKTGAILVSTVGPYSLTLFQHSLMLWGGLDSNFLPFSRLVQGVHFFT